MGIALEVKDNPSTGLAPKDRLVKALKDEEDKGMAVTRAWTSMWQENLNYFFSEQLVGKKKHKDWDWIVINYIWPSAMQEAAKITRAEPQFICDPWEPGDSEAAEAWQGWLQWMWERGLNDEGMALEQLKAILCGKIYGYRVYKLFWEPKVDWDDSKIPGRWLGDVKGKLWKPTLFWATGEESINDGSCGTVRYVELEYALDRWPDYKKQLQEQADKDTGEMMEGGGPDIIGQRSGQGSYPGAGYGGIDRGPDGEGNKLLNQILQSLGASRKKTDKPDTTKYVKISETWFHDYTEDPKEFTEPVPKEELLASGAIYTEGVQLFDSITRQPLAPENWPKREPVKWKSPRFPRGRYILRTGDTILNEDEADQVYQYRVWPFITSPHYVIPFMWQGSDAVQLVKTCQDMINVSVSHLVNHMKQYGDPKVAVERGAIDSPKARDKRHFTIGAGAGAIIRLAKGGLGKFKYMDPPSSSPVIGFLYQLFAQEFKNNIGLQDIAQGKKTSGDLTATESSYLAISAQDRVSLQMTLERLWIQRIGQMAAEICQKNYEPERLVRILGENAIPGVVQISSQMKDVKYDVQVQVSSSLPFDAEKRIARYMQANGLMQGPPSPMLPELLRVLEIPNWRKILERHAGWTEWMAFNAVLQGVQAGKIPPEQGMQMLMQKAQGVIGAALQKQQAQAGPPAGPPGPGGPTAGPTPPQPQPQPVGQGA